MLTYATEIVREVLQWLIVHPIVTHLVYLRPESCLRPLIRLLLRYHALHFIEKLVLSSHGWPHSGPNVGLLMHVYLAKELSLVQIIDRVIIRWIIVFTEVVIVFNLL